MDFSFYLKLGIEHILDLNGYDHMLFVIALCSTYPLKQFKKLLLLLTAFTLGHCLTLILAGLGWLKLPQDAVEFLIPLTILITAILNIYTIALNKPKQFGYALAAGFGLVHGAGFSNFFKHVFENIENNIVLPLLGFNLGIELGQIVIVVLFIALQWLVLKILKLKSNSFALTVNIAVAIAAAYLMFS